MTIATTWLISRSTETEFLCRMRNFPDDSPDLRCVFLYSHDPHPVVSHYRRLFHRNSLECFRNLHTSSNVLGSRVIILNLPSFRSSHCGVSATQTLVYSSVCSRDIKLSQASSRYLPISRLTLNFPTSQKNTIAPRMLRFSRLSSNLSPLLGTIFYAFTEPDHNQKSEIVIHVSEKRDNKKTKTSFQKYPGLNWLLQIPGIVIYDISYSLNPSFLFLAYGIMFGTLILFSAYCVLYAQLYFMLGSIKSRISVRTYTKHVVAVISTIMQVMAQSLAPLYVSLQNLVFVVFFLVPILFLAIVIYSGSDASGRLSSVMSQMFSLPATCIIMVCVFSLHSSANTIVMSFTFPASRQTMFAVPYRICRMHKVRLNDLNLVNQNFQKISVSPLNNISRTAQKIKITSVHF